MRKFSNILHTILISLIPIGFIFKTQDLEDLSMIMLIGFLYVFISYFIKLIKKTIKKQFDFYYTIDFGLILMSVILFFKYLQKSNMDFPALIIVPLFILNSVFYISKKNNADYKYFSTIILFLIGSIFLFAFDFYKAPRKYFPDKWYNRYNVSSDIPISLPYVFKYSETENLSIKAYDLQKNKYYFESMLIYIKAREIEPNNPRLLFDLSQVYLNLNDLETAKSLLDTAIMIDENSMHFYNNRGLIFYKLHRNIEAISDFQNAIRLDSTNSTPYGNIALAYYYEGFYSKSCESIEKAMELGLDISQSKELKRINRKYCKLNYNR